MIIPSPASPRFLLISALLLALTGGCAMRDASTTNSSASSQDTRDNAGRTETGSIVERYTSELDDRFVIGPTAANMMDYRPDWNVDAEPAQGGSIVYANILGDAFFTLDSGNNLTRIDASDGNLSWSAPVADTTDEIHGIARVQSAQSDVLFLTTDSNVWVYDSTNGTFVSKQRLAKVASTAPVVYGGSLVYGSVTGQLVWHQYQVGTSTMAYQLQGAIQLPPALAGNIIVAVTEAGHVMALSASDAIQLWSQQPYGGVMGKPVIGSRAVYVSSLDQHVYAYDVARGRILWKRLTEAELRDPPTLINNHLYQQVPGHGLICFDPLPRDMYDGLIIWTAEGISGNVVGVHNGQLLVWDEAARVISLVDEQTGDLADTVDLPKARRLIVSQLNSGTIYAIGDDGHVSRLVAR